MIVCKKPVRSDTSNKTKKRKKKASSQHKVHKNQTSQEILTITNGGSPEVTTEGSSAITTGGSSADGNTTLIKNIYILHPLYLFNMDVNYTYNHR